MTSVVTLLLMVAATGVAFGVVAVTGARRQRRVHFASLAVALPMLGVTIYVAEQVGRTQDFDPARFACHMRFAYAATVAAVLAVTAGFFRVWREEWRWVHRCTVYAFLILLVAAVATGAWMLASGTPKAKSLAHEDTGSIRISEGLDNEDRWR